MTPFKLDVHFNLNYTSGSFVTVTARLHCCCRNTICPGTKRDFNAPLQKVSFNHDDIHTHKLKTIPAASGNEHCCTDYCVIAYYY